MSIMKQKEHDYAAAVEWAERGIALCGDEAIRSGYVADLEERAAKNRARLR
jgi:hypothetical protein